VGAPSRDAGQAGAPQGQGEGKGQGQGNGLIVDFEHQFEHTVDIIVHAVDFRLNLKSLIHAVPSD